MAELSLERLYAIDATGHWYSGAGAAIEIARRLPPLRIVGGTGSPANPVVLY